MLNLVSQEDALNRTHGILAPLVELLPRPFPYKAFYGLLALAPHDYFVVAPFFARSLIPAPRPNPPPVYFFCRAYIPRWFAPTATVQLGTIDAFAFVAINEVATSRTLLPETNPTPMAHYLTRASKELTQLVST